MPYLLDDGCTIVVGNDGSGGVVEDDVVVGDVIRGDAVGVRL